MADLHAGMFSRKILTEKQLAAIGAAAVESSFTEGLIHDMIVSMSGIQRDKLQPFLGNIMMDGRITILEKLGETYFKSTLAKREFKEAIAAIKHANTGRISLVHGYWEVTNTLLALTSATPAGDAAAKNMKKPNSPRVPAAKAEAIAHEVSQAYAKLLLVWLNRIAKPTMRRAKLRAKLAERLQNR